jgi:ferritin-like metal-binding protein YciE
MTPDTLQEQLTKYLTDMHAIEQQALAQMHAAPVLAGDEQIAQAFSIHLAETEQHEQLIRDLLNARGASPSKLKDVAGMLTGHGFGLFAAFQPDTPGKLVVHAFSYEHMEEGAYDMLGIIATRAGDLATLDDAREIEAQEHAMGDRLDALFDRAVEVSLRDVKPADLDEQLNSYLTDAHAIEIQSLKLLENAVEFAEAPELSNVYRQHLGETEEHEQLIAARLTARGGEPSRIKDAALRLGAINWGGFFAAQPDTPAKLAVFAYAVEHLEIAAYELLWRVADRAGDQETVEIAKRIIVQETDAARIVRALFSEALDATLSAQGVA